MPSFTALLAGKCIKKFREKSFKTRKNWLNIWTIFVDGCKTSNYCQVNVYRTNLEILLTGYVGVFETIKVLFYTRVCGIKFIFLCDLRFRVENWLKVSKIKLKYVQSVKLRWLYWETMKVPREKCY